MDKEKLTRNEIVHRDVVTGVVKMIRRLAEVKPGERISLKEITSIGFDGADEEAKDWIFEFVKDGIINLQKDQIEQVAAGDYSMVWEFTNDYLNHFGYDPVEPMEINP